MDTRLGNGDNIYVYRKRGETFDFRHLMNSRPGYGVISTRPRGLKRQPGGHGIAAGEHLLEAASQMRPDESLASLRNGRGSL